MYERLYLRGIEKYPLLSRKEEMELAVQYKKDKCRKIGNKLITSNLRYVVKVANDYSVWNENVDRAEMIQEGNLGLIRALETFEPKRGFRLITYGDIWIREYMQRFISKNSNVSSVPSNKVYQKLFMKDHTEKEILTDIDIDSYEEHNKHVLQYGHNYDEILNEKNWLKSVHGILDKVEGRDKFIVENRLVSYTPMTLKEMGNQLNISMERARQVELALKNRLKQKFEANKDIMEFIRG